VSGIGEKKQQAKPINARAVSLQRSEDPERQSPKVEKKRVVILGRRWGKKGGRAVRRGITANQALQEGRKGQKAKGGKTHSEFSNLKRWGHLNES